MFTRRSLLALTSAALTVALTAPAWADGALKESGKAAARGVGLARIDVNPGATPIDPTFLHLRAGQIPTPELRRGLEQFVTPQLADGADPVHYVIQLDGPMTPAWRLALRQARVRVLDYLPANAWIVRLDGADAAAVAGLDFIRWYGEYQLDWKVDPEVGRREFVTPERLAVAAAGQSYLTITLFDEQAPEPVQQFIAGLGEGARGARVLTIEYIDGNAQLDVVIDSADIAAVARHPSVQYIEEAPEITLRSNSNNRWVVQTNVAGQTPFYTAGIRGEGQIVGIIDSRIRPDHCSFSDTVPVGPDHRKLLALNAGPGTAGSHGTHVAGTVAGDSGTDNDLRGVAYMSRIVQNIIPSPLASNHPTVLSFLNQHHQQGGRVHTNSWGNDGTTTYDTLCRVFDEFGWLNEDSMVTLAVTNTGNLRNPENAKNLLACGATQPVPNQHQHCYGGTGPTTDQRRKPEIYAPGCSTISASSSTTCGTSSSSGTSMATPAIAGAALLARQYFVDGYYPTGVANPADGFIPSGALVKAALLNSTVDMTGVAGFPSNQEGWGRVLLNSALYLPGDTRRTVVEDIRHADGLSTGNAAEHTVNVISSAEPLHITLVWSEPPASAGAAVATINDLDLIVTSPDGDVYRGNVFSAGQSAPGGTRDVRNNVEQVRLSSPAPGPWIIRVEGTAVNQSTQGYAVAVSGDVLGTPPGVSISLAEPVAGLVTPGTPVTVIAAISPGEDEVVENSAFLAYRFNAEATFTSIPLVDIGEDRFQATIPFGLCDDTPEFYVGVEGVESGLRTAPHNAPVNAYSYQLGAPADTVLLSESFDAMPSGWTATGLWHVQTACAVNPPCESAPWMAFNSSQTCNYDTGARASGSLESPPIVVPPIVGGGTLTLTYCSSMQSENVGNFDRGRVFVNNVEVDMAAESAAWQTRTIDLTQFGGQTITIRFFFDSVDALYNNFRGWQVDNVRLVARVAVCTPPCLADFNGDELINSQDISAFVSAWLADVNEGTQQTDLNRDGVVNSSDVSAFITLWLDAVSGGC